MKTEGFRKMFGNANRPKFIFVFSFLFLIIACLFLFTLRILNQRPQDTQLSAGICVPEIGFSRSIFKVFIVDNGGAPFFEDHKNQIINEFREIAPFSEFFSKIAFYVLRITKQEKIVCESSGGGGLSGSGLMCDDNGLDAFIRKNCGVNDVSRFIKILVTESYSGGSGGEVIVLGSRPHEIEGIDNPLSDKDVSLTLAKHIAIHEVGHNLGLGDLYYGTFYYNGDPSRFYPPEIAIAFPNTDVAGCPKWCKSFKPISEYSSSNCPKIKDEETCRSYGRDVDKSCLWTNEGYSCCVWDEKGFDYFGKCAPAFGDENIGVNCISGTGCYYGAAYGNDAWRPVPKVASIMSEATSEKFDPVSEKWLEEVIEHCLIGDKFYFLNLFGGKKDKEFQKDYKALIVQLPGFKQRIGLCGN